ncbi:MAG: methylmalonyl Co-A mutase-associated GTPase MeaB [Myxococcota bacterium]
MTRRPSPEALAEGVRTGRRAAIGQAISLVESRRPSHRALADALLEALPPPEEPAFRLGISGPPGVGKSTFIEAFGWARLEEGHRVAVLAVDPSSVRTGGSILADKTRMARLSMDERAFVRPSPSGGSLGGVSRRTREAMQVVEAAGFDVVIIETVGVGQSETAVAQMVDSFLLLMLAGAGDDVQGIKRGILEWADLLAITKSDGDNQTRAGNAANDLRSALSIFLPENAPWTPPVRTCSAMNGDGLGQLWEDLGQHRDTMTKLGLFEDRRRQQRVQWFREELEAQMREDLRRRTDLESVEQQVEAGVLAPGVAARRVLELDVGTTS